MGSSKAVKEHDKIIGQIYPTLEKAAHDYVDAMIDQMREFNPPPPEVEEVMPSLKAEYAAEMLIGMKVDLLERWDGIVMRRKMEARTAVGREYIEYINSGEWLNDE